VSKHSLSESEILRGLDKLVQLNKHAPLPSDPIGSSELEIQRGLDKLVQILTGAAGSAATARRPKFTDKERAQLHRQSSILPSAVAELVKILTDHPFEHVREYRLAKLFEALGSTTIIASHVIENKTLERLRTAAATDKNQELAQTTKVAIVIGEELDKFRKQQPDKFRKLRRNGRGHHAIAGIIRGPVNKRLKNELGRKLLGAPMIAQYLKKDPHF
jgi:hypothetical protein